jgi:hypothetical protein
MADVKLTTDFVTTGLAAFTNVDLRELLAYAILEGEGTKNFFSMKDGVKYQTKIPYAKSQTLDISTGAISGSSLTGSGSTTFVDVTLVDTQLKVFETYTKEQLNSTILAPLGKGTDPADLPAKVLVGAIKGQEIFNENEKMIWQADTHGVSTYYADVSTYPYAYSAGGAAGNKFDGILAQVYHVAGERAFVPIVFATSAYSDASVLQWVAKVVTQMEKTIPQLITKPTVLAMGPENFQAYERAAFGLNSTITSQTLNADRKPITSFACPLNPNIKVQAVNGLLGLGTMLLTEPKNIIVVYDGKSEDELYSFNYNPYLFRHELACNYKLGVKVVDPSMCIVTKW